jgi:cell division protein FtsB
MHADLSIWDKLTKVVICLLFVAGLLAVGVWYLPLIQYNERLRQRIVSLDARIKKENESTKQLRASIDALRDPKAVERLARERFGYAKPGETVIRFEEAPSAGPWNRNRR